MAFNIDKTFINLLYKNENFMWNFPGILLIKDFQSNFLGVNRVVATLAGEYQSLDEIIGLNDFNIRSESSRFAETFVKEDQIALSQDEPLTLLCVMRYADGNLYPLLVNKQRIFLEEKEAPVVVCQGIKLNPNSINNLYKNLVLLDRKQHENNQSELGSYLIGSNLPRNMGLSKQQLRCLFYLLRNKTAKEIAKLMNLSPRTVQAYIETIKFKFGCQNKVELIEKAISQGYYYILPDDPLNIKF